jgi:hypothetical protein
MDWRNEIALRQHAYVIGQCVLALARIEGMKAENIQAEKRGDSLPYGEKQFEDEMIQFAIDHNSVIELFTY